MICPILQFGTSRFLQAHADLFVSESGAGPIAVVQTTNSPESRRRIDGFRTLRPYPVHLRGLVAGTITDTTIQVGSIAIALHADTDWPEVTRRFLEARWIISNTGDRGYTLDPTDAPDHTPPRSFPAKLTTLLLARFNAGAPPVTLLPCELISGNGTTLRTLVLTLAETWALPAAFIDWLQTCLWVNALVDRIVPESLDPVGAIAEPYALWAIANQPGLVPPCTHPDIEIVPDLAPYERLKLYILNLGHTALAERWLADRRNPDEIMTQALADPSMADTLATIHDTEVLPVFAAIGLGPEAITYRTTVLDRFANPFLRHRLADIAVNHAEKKHRRIAAFLDLAYAAIPGYRAPILAAMRNSGIK